MNVQRVDGFTLGARSFAGAPVGSTVGEANPSADSANGTVKKPLPVVPRPGNGNPGIVPPWLQGEFHILPWPFPIVPTDPVVGVELIGVAPISPDTPVIM